MSETQVVPAELAAPIELSEQEQLENQKRSVLAAVSNNVITALKAVEVTLPVELPHQQTSTELNQQFYREPRSILLSSGSNYLEGADVGKDPEEMNGTMIPFSNIDQLAYFSKWISQKETILQEYADRHPEVDIEKLTEQLDIYVDGVWDMVCYLKQELPEVTALLETLLPSREALQAVLQSDSEGYTKASGIEGVEGAKIQMIRQALNNIIEVEVATTIDDESFTPGIIEFCIDNMCGYVDHTNFEEQMYRLMERTEAEEKEIIESRYRLSERELVGKKLAETDHIPVSDSLKYSLQVIAYNEMPNLEGPSFELPNLAVQLRSVITAIERYKQEQRGSAAEIEILYNINNKPHKATLANTRSLALLQGIIGETPIDDLIQQWDWVPTADATYPGVPQKRVEGIREFYRKLIVDARSLIQEGFHIVPIDGTDGAFIARKGDKPKSKNDLQRATQGSRRMLVTEVGVQRMKRVEKDDQYIAELDADIVLKPTYFCEFDDMLKEKDNPGVCITSPRIKPFRGFYSLDLVRATSADGTPLLSTFTPDLLEKIKEINVNDNGATAEAHIEALQNLGLSEEQIQYLLSITPETMEKVSGKTSEGYIYRPFENVVRTLKIFGNAETQTEAIRRYFYYTDLQSLFRLIRYRNGANPVSQMIGSLSRQRGTAKRDTVTGTGFLSLHLIKRSAYENSGGWEIAKDLGEDSSFLSQVKYASGQRVEFKPADVVRIRDRVRDESWMGGDISKRASDRELTFPREEWTAVCRHLERKFGIEEKKLNPETLPFEIIMLLQDRTKVSLSAAESALIDEVLGRIKISELAKEGAPLMVMSLVEVVREVVQNPVEYRKLYDFFVPLAAYFPVKEDSRTGSGVLSFISRKVRSSFKKKAA